MTNTKDKLIEKLQEENCSLHHELYKQCRLVDKAEKYEKERQSILAENKEIKEKFKTLENDYSIKLKEEVRKVKNEYEDENYHLFHKFSSFSLLFWSKLNLWLRLGIYRIVWI